VRFFTAFDQAKPGTSKPGPIDRTLLQRLATKQGTQNVLNAHFQRVCHVWEEVSSTNPNGFLMSGGVKQGRGGKTSYF